MPRVNNAGDLPGADVPAASFRLLTQYFGRGAHREAAGSPGNYFQQCQFQSPGVENAQEWGDGQLGVQNQGRVLIKKQGRDF